MSAPHIKWAASQRNLSPVRRLVLIALADRANGERVCFPSFARIAADYEISQRSVVSAVEYLESRGLIIRITDPDERLRLLLRAGGRPTARSNVYRILRDLDETEKTPPVPQPEVYATVAHRRLEWPEDEPETCAMAAHVDQTTPDVTVQSPQDQCAMIAHESPIESPIKKEVSTLLRNGDADKPPAVVALNPDIRRMVWEEGKAIVRHLTGKLDTPARRQIGVFLREAKDDCTVVLDVLRTASRETPYDPIPWIIAGIQARIRSERKLSVHETIRRDGNLPSFLGAFAPRPDSDEPQLAQVGDATS